MTIPELKKYIKQFESDILKGTLQVIDDTGEIDESIILLLYDPINRTIEVSRIDIDQIEGIDYMDYYEAISLYIKSQVSQRSELVHISWIYNGTINEEDHQTQRYNESDGVVIYFESNKDFSIYAYKTIEKSLKVDITGELIDHYRFEFVDDKHIQVNDGLGLVKEPGVFKQL